MKMTIEEKIIGISETKDMKESIESIIKTSVKMGIEVIAMIVLETNMTRVIIDLATKTGVGAKINTKTKTGTEMTAMTKLEVGLRRKITCVIMMIYFTQKLKEYTKFCKQ